MLRISISKEFLIFCTIFIFAVSVTLAVSENESIAETIILAEDVYPPFSNPDGSGLSNEIVLAAFKAAGINIRLKVFPFPRLMKMVKIGKAPAGFNCAVTQSLKQDYIFPEHPLYTIHTRFYYNKENPLVIDTENDVTDKIVKKGIIVGEVLGYIYPPFYEALKKAVPPLHSEAIRSDEKLIRKLILKRNRIALMTGEVVNYHVHRMKLEGHLGYGAFEWEVPLHIVFSKKHPQGASLAENFDRGMEIIRENGTYDRLVRKYPISK